VVRDKFCLQCEAVPSFAYPTQLLLEHRLNKGKKDGVGSKWTA